MAYACDIDGVVADFCGGFSKIMNGINPRYPIITSNNTEDWNWKTWYAPDESRDKVAKDIEYVWENVIKKVGYTLWNGLDPLFPDQMNALNRHALTEPIIFMTRRDGPTAWKETVDWLRRY